MKNIFLFLVASMLLISCNSRDTTIALQKVGPITNLTTINELSELFKNDSIVSRYSEGDLGNINDYVMENDTHLIYKKGGELLLSIMPVNPLDSVSKIKIVTVFSDDFKTEGGVSINSTFNDLNVHHVIEKLEATFNSITVFVKDINATVILDKSKTGVKPFTLGEVDKALVPETTALKSLTVWMEE